ncbi:MAG: tRNA uracil 4-sulfurtransferase ThiI [Eubacteriales bacterium]|nr:tRNA uracil 4-sulfurtransferase ThiI [Eubacteriales bacterium]
METEEVILLRFGEIALKGLNRHRFEEQLIRNLAAQVKHHGRYEIQKRDGRVYIEPQYSEEMTLNQRRDLLEFAIDKAKKCFGVVSLSPVLKLTKSSIEDLMPYVCELCEKELRRGRRSFKVEAKRSDKSYPQNSPEIAAAVGEMILDAHPELHVDVHEPDFILWIEVRDRIYIYSEIIAGPRGLPVGTSAKTMVLLSGGIDSPVAAYMMASRGCPIEAIYFHTFPYTSDRARDKVLKLAQIVSEYSGPIVAHVVDFTDIQLKINESCPEDLLTIVMRRMMMRIADRYAEFCNCPSLLTGESLGQVASQTTEAIAASNEVSSRPIFRPLIGLDKDQTIEIARRIGSFETSILPYEDCCTVFVAKHPSTRPQIEKVHRAEAELDIEALVEMGLAKISSYSVRSHKVSEISNYRPR